MRILDAIARAAFGLTQDEARAKGICIRCKKPVITEALSEEDLREYNISAICLEDYKHLIDTGRLD